MKVRDNEIKENEHAKVSVSRLRECRMKYGITLKDISNKTYIPIETLEAWENGSAVPRDMRAVARVAEYIKCDVSDITGNHAIQHDVMANAQIRQAGEAKTGSDIGNGHGQAGAV